MFFIAKKISIGGIYEKGFDIMVFYIVSVCLLDIEEIFIRNVLFIGPVPFFNILLQFLYRTMQVNEQVGLNKLLVNDLK